MHVELIPLELSDTRTILAISGSMDVVGAGNLENMFIDFTAARKQNTLVDMSAVHFLGSTGIRVFVSAAKALKREHKKLVLCGVQPPIEKALRLSGFDSVVELFPTLDEAKAQIGVT